MWQKKLLLCGVLVFLFGNAAESARILYFNPTMSLSHLLAPRNLLKQLADRGHQVTMVTAFPENDVIENIREISVPLNDDLIGNFPFLIHIFYLILHFFLFVEHSKTVTKEKAGFIGFRVKHFVELQTITASDMMKTPQFQALLKEKFDLVILGFFFVDFPLGLGPHFNCPTVVLFSGGSVRNLDDYVGNVSPISSVPQVMISQKEPMKFTDRIRNLAVSTFETLFTNHMRRIQNGFYTTHFPDDKYPSYTDVRRNVSLVLLNTHFTQTLPRPYVPNMVEVGGLQIKEKPSALPEVCR
jgi:hypothetical protein